MAKYVVSWIVEGAWTVEAKSAEGAEAKFDKAWNSPKGIMPARDGEVSVTEIAEERR